MDETWKLTGRICLTLGLLQNARLRCDADEVEVGHFMDDGKKASLF